MYWILATLFIVVALAVPRLRPLGIAGCVVLGAMLIWAVTQRLRAPAPEPLESVQPRGRPASPVAAVRRVPLSDLDAENLQLSGGGAPFELEGRIVNRSEELRIKSVTLRVTRRDCYEGALDPSGCIRMWQDQKRIALAVPPQQSRDFSVSIWMHGAAPRPRGTLKDVFEVVAASGEAVGAQSER